MRRDGPGISGLPHNTPGINLLKEKINAKFEPVSKKVFEPESDNTANQDKVEKNSEGSSQNLIMTPLYKKEQKIIFEKQLEIASEIQIPVIIHDRDAHEDAFNIIKKYNLKNVVFHCFSGDTDFALKCVENGYYIAIGGVVTFKNAIMLKEAVKNIPIENMLLETDSPYLAPVPFRGKINSPEYLVYIAREIALIKNINSEEVEKQTTINAKRIFDFNGQRKIG